MYFEYDAIMKFDHSRIFATSQPRISAAASSENGQRGTITHFFVLNHRPARVRAMSKMGTRNFKEEMLRNVCPMSSAHALETHLSQSSIFAAMALKNGSMARAKSDPDSGQP